MGIKMHICIQRLFSDGDAYSRFQTSRIAQALKEKQMATAKKMMAHCVMVRAEKSANM